MTITTFTYTKADGKISNRVLAGVSKPNKFVSGTDVTELPQEQQVLYAMAIQEAKTAYLEAIKVINDKFDVNHNFRQFKPECMTNVVEEDI